MVRLKRVYEEASPKDGFRVLVDRLWPRGLSRERAAVDLWLKEVAPSPELRIWFGHDATRFAKFRERYREELRQNPAAIELARLTKQHPTIMLLYGAKDPQINHAAVLLEFLTGGA